MPTEIDRAVGLHILMTTAWPFGFLHCGMVFRKEELSGHQKTLSNDAYSKYVGGGDQFKETTAMNQGKVKINILTLSRLQYLQVVASSNLVNITLQLSDVLYCCRCFGARFC